MAQPKKPDTDLARQTTYGKLPAGQDIPLGIAAVKAACAAGKTHPPELHKSWSKKSTTDH